MRLNLACLTLALAAVAGAQAPATTAPVAAAAPKGPSMAEFRIAGFMVSGERNVDFMAATPTKATGSLRGVEVLLRGGSVGLYARSLSGEFGTNKEKIISADARILLFPPIFTVFGGFGKRALQTTRSTRLNSVYMGGVSSTISIGGSGLRTYISGAFLVSPPEESSTTSTSGAVKNTTTGIEGEAAVMYRFPVVPFFVSLGYRTETFNFKSATISAPEEVRGLRIGGGLQFGGH